MKSKKVYNLSSKQKADKLLEKIVSKIKGGKDYEKLKEELFELSPEENKEELFNDFIKKVEIFLDYSLDEEEDKKMNFPTKSWVDSFFENE